MYNLIHAISLFLCYTGWNEMEFKETRKVVPYEDKIRNNSRYYSDCRN